MSNKTLEGMARCFEIASDKGTYDVEAMRGALLWLSKNVSDEMVRAYMHHKPRLSRDLTSAVRESMSAALRAAAGSALEAKP